LFSPLHLVSKQDLEKAVLEIFGNTVEPRGTAAVPPLDKIFFAGCLQEGTRVPGENLVGPAVPSDTGVPMIFHKSVKTTTTSVQVLVPSPK
jgi:hypothetical protein